MHERRLPAQVVDFEQLFETLPSPHMLLDRELCFVAVNAAYERAVMRERDELIGRNIFGLFPNEGESGRRLRASFERVLATGETDTLPYIPYDIPRPQERGGGMEQRYWTAVHKPVLGVDGAVTGVMQNTSDVTEIVLLRQAASLPFRSGEAQLLERAREAEEQHETLLAESEDFRRLFQLAPGFFAVLTGPGHVFTFANDAYARLVGGRALVGLPLREALPEIEGQGFIEMLDGVYSTGRPTGGQSSRVLLQQADGSAPRETFLDFSYDAIRDADGTITGVFVQGMDRTDAVNTQRRQRLLLAELNHRVKNTLASVQSIVTQTLRSAPDADTARRAVEARLKALSNAHNLLSAEEWASARLSAIVRHELSIFENAHLADASNDVILSPKASIALALMVHELATNAAKYGGLSVPDGGVAVAWWIEGDGTLAITWREEGGPPVATPARKGFGTRMIEGVVEGELAGEWTPGYGPEGFSCAIRIPRDAWSPSGDG